MAVIFGLKNRTELLSEPSRAFLRHVYNQFYHDFANVDIKAGTFIPEVTFDYALKSFRNAVLRYGMHFRTLYNSRYHSTLEGVAPKEAREKYPQPITIDEDGSFALNRDLERAIAQAEANAISVQNRMNSTQRPFHAPRGRPRN